MRGILIAVLSIPLALVAIVEGQSGERRVMTMQSDGGPPRTVMFSTPSLGNLREPDFTRRDIEAIDKALTFDEAQRAVVKVLHDGYLSALDQAAERLLPKRESMDFKFGGGGLRIGAPHGVMAGGASGQDGEPQPLAIAIAGDNGELGEAIREAMQEAGATGAPVQIGVRMVAGGPGGAAALPPPGDEGEYAGAGPDEEVVITRREGGSPGAPDGQGAPPQVEGAAPAERNVAVRIDTGDQALSDETRAKLETLAIKLREQVEQRAAQAELEGGAAPAPHVAGFPDPGPDLEAMKARMEEFARGAAAFAREKMALRDRFVGDMSAYFTPDQGARWPAFDHALIRDKTLPRGRLDGERVDLIAIADGANLDPAQQASVEPILRDYDQVMHAALTQRNHMLLDAQAQIDSALNAGEQQKALNLVDRVTALRVAVRGVNEQFTETIAGRLGGEAAVEFREAVLKAAYPRLSRPTAAQRAFAAARKLEGLAPELTQAIDAQEQAYQPQLVAMNDVIRAAIREHQPGEPRRNIERTQSLRALEEMHAGSAAPADPVRDAMRRRTDLDERTMKQLYAMFAPEQVATLPKLPSQRRSGPIVIESAAR